MTQDGPKNVKGDIQRAVSYRFLAGDLWGAGDLWNLEAQKLRSLKPRLL
jgi:hypothetical protein